MICCEVVFYGHVQGVGFRYTARSLAEAAGLLGWVRNCSDGSVALLLEGKRSAVESLIDDLEGRFSIREKKISFGPFSGRHKGFSIVY